MEEVSVLDINGKEFFLLDTLDDYYYFAEINRPDNICVLKQSKEEEKEYLNSISEEELNDALIKYSQKFEKC